MISCQKVMKQFRHESSRAKLDLLQEIVRLELHQQGGAQTNATSFRAWGPSDRPCGRPRRPVFACREGLGTAWNSYFMIFDAIFKGTAQDDPLCMISIFLACVDAVLLSMRQIQHHILRLY